MHSGGILREATREYRGVRNSRDLLQSPFWIWGIQWASARTVYLGYSSDVRNTCNQSLAIHEECMKNGKSSRVIPLHSRNFLWSQGQFNSSTLSAHSEPARDIMRSTFQSDVAPRCLGCGLHSRFDSRSGV
jgi:hypothetical protein